MKAIKEYLKSISFVSGFAFKYTPKTSLLMVVLYIGSGILPYANAFLLGYLVNKIILGAGSGSYENLWQVIFLYAFLNTMPALIGNLQMYISRYRWLIVQMEADLHILKHKERIDIASYEDPKFQDLLYRANRNGLSPLQQLGNAQFDLVRAVVSFIVGTLVSIHFSLWVYLVVIITAIPAFITDVKFAGRSWSIWAKDSPEQRKLGNYRVHLMNRNYLIETKLLQSRDKLLNWIRIIYSDFADKQRGFEKNRVWGTTVTDLIAFIGFGVGLLFVVRSVTDGESSIGTLVYIMTALAVTRRAIADVLDTLSGQYENSLIAKDIMEIINTESVVLESPYPKTLNLDMPPEIVFKNVSFKYPHSETWVLKNVNLTFTPGSKIGLVGNNGAGKTTLVKLLCRVYDPTEGSIFINGIDLKDVSISEWWSYLGVMFQDYATYDFKVREAIAIGRSDEDIDLDRVRESARISQANGFIEQLKGGYEHQLGSEFGGIELSKGQRQKLSIAKVLYRKAKFMILDEPTASVDAESEAKIFESLENLSKDTSALLISHDFSTISECDQIFVLDGGELIESGNHKELMKAKGKYAELYNLQAKGFQK